MICCFADVVAFNPQSYVRPILLNEGPLVIKNGRHPIISVIPTQQLQGSFVPNDSLITDIESCLIITGPNGSGKVKATTNRFVITRDSNFNCFFISCVHRQYT